ncbi:MAG: hypothetical protein HYW02_06925 [Deltaproteobacteria bacterium]|nr:hypothetical protein [Deltaproteobacteria bacterium]MBI2501178.1 hypothetical protein [Deltaproteobacteria bacterium]
MQKLFIIFLFSLLTLPALLFGKSQKKSSVILTAFGGINEKGETWGEPKPFLDLMKSRKDRTSDFTFCDQVFTGKLYETPILLAVTGIGMDASGTCMEEILFRNAKKVQEVLWSGIAGVSPQKGELYDEKGLRRLDREPVMLGDLCVSPLAYSYDLHRSSVNDWQKTEKWWTSADGWWKMPWKNRNLFAAGQSVLADELLKVTSSLTWPEMPEAILQKIRMYHPKEAVRAPKIYRYEECAEVSSNNFWHGAPEDQLARSYVATLIQKALNLSKEADQVIAFTAMEAVSWMNVVEEWNQLEKTAIPFVNVRGASNYDQPPPGPNGKPVISSQESLQKGFDLGGEEYAAETAALPILKMFELRGLKK